MEIPNEDLKASGLLMHVFESDIQITIEASELREYNEENLSLLSGDIRAKIKNTSDEVIAEISAIRTQIDHQSTRWIFHDSVRLQGQDGFSLNSDSLIWDFQNKQISIPGTLLIRHEKGLETGRNFRTDSLWDIWEMYDVDAFWSLDGNEDSLEVHATSERSQYVEGKLQLRYENVKLDFSGMQLIGPTAIWHPVKQMLIISGGVEGSNSSGTFRAREIQVDVNSKNLRGLGNVELQQGSFHILSTEWIENWSGDKSTIVSGTPASFLEEGRRIDAHKMTYLDDMDLLIADSNAVFIEGEHYLAAEQLRYDSIIKTIFAEGDIKLRNAELNGLLLGDKLELDLDEKEGWIVGGPALVRLQDELVFSADSILFNNSLKHLAGRGYVALKSGSLEITALNGSYYSDEQKLFFIDNINLNSINEKDEFSYHVDTDSLAVQLVEGEIDSITIGGVIEGKINLGNNAHVLISGTDGSMHFLNGELKILKLLSFADITYDEYDNVQFSRLKGQSVKLVFDNRDLKSGHALGNARLISRIGSAERLKDLNQVDGSEIDLYFSDGSIDKVFVEPSVEGIYSSGEKD